MQGQDENQGNLESRPESGTSLSPTVPVLPLGKCSTSASPVVTPRALSFKFPPRLKSLSREGSPGRTSPRFVRERTEDEGSMLDSIYDDDFLQEDGQGRRWKTLHAVLMLSYSGRKPKLQGEFVPIAGHSSNFRNEDGYVLKALTQNEGAIVESIQRERALRPFVPQFMGYVERDGRTYIKMQDVLLSMSEPNFMDIKMGLRTFAEAEVSGDKLRMDLLEKALVIQKKVPAVFITDEEKANGITKYRFMSLRDSASSSATLGFRVQGMMNDHKALTSKDFSDLRSATLCRGIFRTFFKSASEEQRQGLLQRLRDLHAAISTSEWFITHEVIGSSLLVAYDTANPSKFGIWMIDFARTEPARNRLTHVQPWTLGSQEDGYLLGVKSLIKIWSDELSGDIPLNAPDWHYRAEGHDCIVVGYHGPEPQLHGKVLRLAKECSTLRHRDTLAGHPATAYNDFVSTMLSDYIGGAADPGTVVHVDRPFLEAVAAQVSGSRPTFRAEVSQLDLTSEYQLLLEDGSYVKGSPHSQTIAVELKLKMGHLPPPVDNIFWIKGVVSRFAMQQYLKLMQGTTGKISGYCPLDLFSGDFDRTRDVVLRLLDTPQNNLRVFLGDSLLVPQTEGRASSLQSGKAVVDSKLGPLLGTRGNLSPSHYLSDLVAKCLIQPSAAGDVPLMKKIQNIQRLGLDIEVLWPFVKDNVQELQSIYHMDPLDVAAQIQALPPTRPLLCHSRQQRERRGQKDCSIEALQREYATARSAREPEVRAVKALLPKVDTVLELRKFLLSQSLKDASLMVAIAAVPEHQVTPNAPDIVRGPDGRAWRFSFRVLDLDSKNVDHLPKWYRMDRDIVRTYMRAVYEEEFGSAPASPKHSRRDNSGPDLISIQVVPPVSGPPKAAMADVSAPPPPPPPTPSLVLEVPVVTPASPSAPSGPLPVTPSSAERAKALVAPRPATPPESPNVIAGLRRVTTSPAARGRGDATPTSPADSEATSTAHHHSKWGPAVQRGMFSTSMFEDTLGPESMSMSNLSPHEIDEID